MDVHVLKIDPSQYEGVRMDTKKHEVRVNDRDFKVDDILHLKEFDRETQTYTGRECHRQITYITHAGEYGLPDGLCVLSIQR